MEERVICSANPMTFIRFSPKCCKDVFLECTHLNLESWTHLLPQCFCFAQSLSIGSLTFMKFCLSAKISTLFCFYGENWFSSYPSPAHFASVDFAVADNSLMISTPSAIPKPHPLTSFPILGYIAAPLANVPMLAPVQNPLLFSIYSVLVTPAVT